MVKKPSTFQIPSYIPELDKDNFDPCVCSPLNFGELYLMLH